MNPKPFVFELRAQSEYGWPDNRRRFVQAAGLTLFALLGGRAVQRETLATTVEKPALAMPPYLGELNTAIRRS